MRGFWNKLGASIRAKVLSKIYLAKLLKTNSSLFTKYELDGKKHFIDALKNLIDDFPAFIRFPKQNCNEPNLLKVLLCLKNLVRSINFHEKDIKHSLSNSTLYSFIKINSYLKINNI